MYEIGEIQQKCFKLEFLAEIIQYFFRVHAKMYPIDCLRNPSFSNINFYTRQLYSYFLDLRKNLVSLTNKSHILIFFFIFVLLKQKMWKILLSIAHHSPCAIDKKMCGSSSLTFTWEEDLVIYFLNNFQGGFTLNQGPATEAVTHPQMRDKFPKCGAKLCYGLVVGPLFWECPDLGALPYIFKCPTQCMIILPMYHPITEAGVSEHWEAILPSA